MSNKKTPHEKPIKQEVKPMLIKGAGYIIGVKATKEEVRREGI